MSEPRITICTIGLGGWYDRGVCRLVEQFHAVSPGIEIMAWINTLPPGAQQFGKNDITAYAAKPFALLHAAETSDIVIWLDSAFVPIAHIRPLIDYTIQTGYYFCRNGFRVGQWAGDWILRYFGVTRDQALEIEERSGYALALDVRNQVCKDFLIGWAGAVPVMPGPCDSGRRSSR